MDNSNPQFRRYMIRFIIAFVAYAVTVMLYGFLVAHPVAGAWRIPLALLPSVPIAFGLYYQLQAIRSTDELQRRIYSEAMIVSALFTGTVTFTYAFLEQVGFPRFSTFLYFPMLIGVWGIAMAFLRRRYL